MASGVVVVGFAGAAAQRLVVDGCSGCLAVCGESAAGVAVSFAGTLERVLTHAAPCETMRRHARATARLADWPADQPLSNR